MTAAFEKLNAAYTLLAPCWWTKLNTLDRRGRAFVDWNTDRFGFTGADDPI